MRLFRTILATAILAGGIAVATTDAGAMPVQPLVPAASPDAGLTSVYYGYGWRRPYYRRPFYAYGWRRPFGWRGYGPGYRRGWRNRRFIGSRAR